MLTHAADSIVCYDATWWAMLVPIMLVLVLFSFGVPLVAIYILKTRHAELQIEGGMVHRLFGMLYEPYKPELYYFVRGEKRRKME